MKALVLTFDRLTVRFLGCYGNDWAETPNFDLIASQSVLFENHYIENVKTNSVNHAWWSGCCFFDEEKDGKKQNRSPFQSLKETGVAIHAVVEDEANAPPLPQQGFENVVESYTSEELFDHAISKIDQLEQDDSWLLWVKSKGIAFPTLPAEESLKLFLEDDDIAVAEEITARFADWLDGNSTRKRNERVAFGETFSVDEERMLHCVYAACVYEWDLELGRLWEQVVSSQQDDLLIVMAGARGEWLGEPLPDNHPDCQLCESVIHTPLLISFGDVEQSVRMKEFVQTVDLLPTLFDWFDVSPPSEFEGQSLLTLSKENAEKRSYYFCSNQGRCLSVGSEDFFLRTHSDAAKGVDTTELDTIELDGNSCQFYHKPEDNWCVNDVGNQWPQRREEMLQILSDFRQKS